MGVFSRLRRKPSSGTLRTGSDSDLGHLREWASSRHGVEAYVEPKTTVTDTTVVLVAHDGEWTRRRVAGDDGARRVGKKLGIPIYDVSRTGYPQRMRDYDNRNRGEKKRRGDLS